MNTNTADAGFERTGSILKRTYARYMIPAALTAVGLSLSEFVDSLVVGRLLNSDAFAVVNLGLPIVYVVCTIYVTAGNGGALLFAEYLGKKEKEKSDAFFTASTVFSLAAGLLLMLLLLILHPYLGDFLGCPEELRPVFDRYSRILFFFAPVAIALMNITYFLPVIGMPFLSTGLVLFVNILNILLDIVLIKGFGMGCEGAALATLLSYVTALIIAFFIFAVYKPPLSLRMPKDPVRCVLSVLKRGFPVGVVQAGYVITVSFCNNYMNLAFGMAGVVTISLFYQMDSVIGIAIYGIAGNNASFSAMLKGEGDYYGIRTLTKRVAIMMFAVCTVLSVCFSVFSAGIAHAFNITDEAPLALITRFTPVYVVYFPLRTLLLLLKELYSTLDRSFYASALGILDKVVAVPLTGSILYRLIGGYGIIAAFPVSYILLMITVALINRRIVRKSNGRFSPVLLLDEEYPLKALYSFTVSSSMDPAGTGRIVEERLKAFDVEEEQTSRICLAVEEIISYIGQHSGRNTAADIMISKGGGGYIIVLRSAGEPFCPFSESNPELSENELMLGRMFDMKHEYIFGLNSTTLTTGA